MKQAQKTTTNNNSKLRQVLSQVLGFKTRTHYTRRGKKRRGDRFNHYAVCAVHATRLLNHTVSQLPDSRCPKHSSYLIRRDSDLYMIKIKKKSEQLWFSYIIFVTSIYLYGLEGQTSRGVIS